MKIIPNVRKRTFISVATLIIGLLLLFVFQTSVNYFAQRDVLEKIEERRLKIDLSRKALKLSENILADEKASNGSVTELEQITRQLLPIMHTAEGKVKVSHLIAAIANFKNGRPVAELINAARELNEFQHSRLGDDLKNLQAEIIKRGFHSFLTSIVITVILGLAVGWGLHRLAREYLLTKVIMQGTTNGIIVGNDKGRITVLNDTFCCLQGGCKKADMVGAPLAEAGEVGRLLALAIQNHKFMMGQEVVCRDLSNQEICLLMDTVPWLDEDRKIIGGMAVVRDHTQQWLEKQKVSAENEELREKAERDSMTGLYNYRAFIQHTHQLIFHKKQSHFSLLMIDLDNFKVYNDTLGHLAGDRLLVELANIMINTVRDDDMVARYGGDEFVIVLESANLNRAIEVGERLRLSIANHGFIGQECLPGAKVTVSIGIAVYPENGAKVEDLIRCADTALYQAKRASRNKLEYYREYCCDGLVEV